MSMYRVLPKLTLVAVMAAAAWGAAAAGGRPLADARLAPSLLRTLAGHSARFPVIVHLRAPALARLHLSPRDHAAEARRQAVIGPLLEREIGALSAHVPEDDLRVVRRLRLQPVFAAVATRQGLAELLDSPEVELIEPDLHWRLHTEQGLPLINATVAHGLGLAGDGAAVAVIDTGVDATHPALGGSVAPNAKVVYSLDTADDDEDASDCGVHGTAVAAVIAGSSYQWNPMLRFAGGVAPATRILAYKATPDADCGTFSLSAVLAAMEDALLHRQGDGYSLSAINLSVGAGAFAGPCEGLSASYRRAVTDATAAGIAVVASAGNEGLTDAMAAPACLGQVISVGSVWDVDTNGSDHSFCLDPGCTALCNDSLVAARTVTCYSNSSASLDLLAPSEYLTSARARAQTLVFGGTSGAAAYVTGAVALLAAASPGTGPASIRALLSLTGQPVVDRRNGRVRSLIDLAAALDHDTVIAATASAANVPASQGSLVSQLTMAEQGPVGAARVLLHLACDRPERLRVRLTAPDGTSVLLHNRGPGNIPDVDGLTRFGGLWGTYPDDLVPADSLGLLAGVPTQGTWTLEVSDTGAAGGGVAATLIDWALEIEPRTPPPPPLLVIPAVAHQRGANHTSWSTDLRLVNPFARPRRVRLTLVPSGADGATDFYQSSVRLPAGMGVDLPDVVRRIFGRDETSGLLLLTSDDGEVLASSRTATGTQGGGTCGEFVGAVRPVRDAIAAGEPALAIPHLESTPEARTNLGFSEVSGRPLSLTVHLFDGDTGAAVGNALAVHLAAFSHLQVRVRTPSPRPNLYATVTVASGDGRAVAYASTIDNATQDAAFIPALRPEAVSELMVPVVASTGGRAGTRWRSEVRIANLGQKAVRLRLEYRPRHGEAGAMTVTERRLPAGRVLVSRNVVGELLGLAATAGSLRVVVDGEPAPIAITSRTANCTDEGSFGQYVGAVEEGLRGAAAVVHVDGGPRVRSNFGLCEVAGAPLRVRCTLKDALGNPLGTPASFALQPYRLLQVNDVFAFFDAAARLNARLELEVEDGDGAYAAYASVIDGVTGDAILVPAQPITPNP